VTFGPFCCLFRLVFAMKCNAEHAERDTMLFQHGFFFSSEALRSIRMGINVQNPICPVCLFVPDQLERSFAHKDHSDNLHILCAARSGRAAGAAYRKPRSTDKRPS
jgi:hypothetical protein